MEQKKVSLEEREAALIAKEKLLLSKQAETVGMASQKATVSPLQFKKAENYLSFLIPGYGCRRHRQTNSSFE